MDWTVEDDMVDGLFCATLTGRRGSSLHERGQRFLLKHWDTYVKL